MDIKLTDSFKSMVCTGAYCVRYKNVTIKTPVNIDFFYTYF